MSNLLSQASQSSHHSERGSILESGFSPSVHPKAMSHQVTSPFQMTHASQGFDLLISNSFYQISTLHLVTTHVFTKISYPDISFLAIASGKEHLALCPIRLSRLLIPLLTEKDIFFLLPTFYAQFFFSIHLDFVSSLSISSTVSTLLSPMCLFHICLAKSQAWMNSNIILPHPRLAN